MKKIVKFFTLSAVIIMAAACEENAKIQLADLQVNVKFAESFAQESVEGVIVKITNTADNVEKEMLSDASGSVIFTDLTAGVYNVTASKQKTVSLTLNASKNDVNVVPEIENKVELVLDGQLTRNDFVIKEVYCCANKDFAVMMKDTFIELYNNTDDVLYADGLAFAVLKGDAGQANSKQMDLPLDECVYSGHVAMVPGDGKTFPVEPGKTFLIAYNAMDFTSLYVEGNPQGHVKEQYLDLSGADLEYSCREYLEEKGFTHNAFFDMDNPKVPDAKILYLSKVGDGVTFDVDMNGASIVIFRDVKAIDFEKDLVDSPFNTPTTIEKFVKIPNDIIIDGVEILNNAKAGSFKRMSTLIDASFTCLKPEGNPCYSGMSSRRKMGENGKLIDTNNSANDFESLAHPTPRKTR